VWISHAQSVREIHTSRKNVQSCDDGGNSRGIFGEAYLEVKEVATQMVAAAIEILSPSNKRVEL
jgi:Protein of unknown function (DUF4058)